MTDKYGSQRTVPEQFSAGAFLLIADASSRRCTVMIQRMLVRYRSVRQVSEVEEALELLDRHRDIWTGIVLAKPECAEELEQLSPATAQHARRPPIACVSGLPQAHAGPYILGLPPQSARMLVFIQRALVSETLHAPAIRDALCCYAASRRLTPRETEIVAATIAGVASTEYVDEIGVSRNTRRRQVQSILRKCDAQNIDRLALRILKTAIDELLAC
jgi:DNA-binding NarL/FixJ family response regulator